MKKRSLPFLLLVIIFSLAGCGKDGVPGFKVGGTALGLDEGDTLVLQINLRDNIALSSDAHFTFPASLPNNTFYNVTIQRSPSGKTCSAANNEGYISGANINNVDVICSTDSYTVGGTVTGLDLGSSLVVQNNKDDDLTITSDGTFTFPTALADNAKYDVTILTNNSGKTCAVSNGSNIIAGKNVTNVVIVCSTTSFSVGGTVTGIPAGKTLLLQNNLQDDITITADGSFTFATTIPNTGGYHVSVLQEPSGTNCTVSSGTGVISGANVTNVDVTCVNSPALMLFLSSYHVPSGNIGGVASADDYCDRDTQCPKYGVCKALIVDGVNRIACTTPNCVGGEQSDKHVDWVFENNREYVMPDKETSIGTTNDNGVFDFPLTNAFSSYDKYAWTGLYADWTTGSSCEGWYNKSGYKYGNIGDTNSTDTPSIYSAGGSTSTCRYSRGYLYCVEQPD